MLAAIAYLCSIAETASHGSFTADRLDRQIIHGLLVDPRASFALLAAVLGSSEQTVARRYRRLKERGVIRVRGLVPPEDPMHAWLVRVEVRPGAATAVAGALAARADVSWVTIAAGGAEVACYTTPRDAEQHDALLLERLPRTNQVTSLSAHAIMHRYAGAGANEWHAFDDPLQGGQARRLAAARGPRPLGVLTNPPGGAAGARLEDADAPLAAALREDGRMTHAMLAEITGWSPSRVRRRLRALLASGAIYVDVEIANELVGCPTLALLWLTVAPSGLTEVGERLAAAPEAAFAAAVSGRANLHVAVACASPIHLHDFLVREVGSHPAIHTVETSPIVRRVKQAGSIMAGARLPPPV